MYTRQKTAQLHLTNINNVIFNEMLPNLLTQQVLVLVRHNASPDIEIVSKKVNPDFFMF